MATSGILNMVNSTLAAMGNIPLDWSVIDGAEKSRPTLLFQLVRMWNDQIKQEKSGNGYLFEKPAAFLQLLPGTSSQVGDNISMTDYIFRVHVVDMQLDAGDGLGMDQNLAVYSYRDLVVQAIAGFQPVNCSTLFIVDEQPDYEHDNVFHYTIDFKGNFTDTKGSDQDPDQTKYIYKAPDTEAEITAEFVTEIEQ